MSGVGLSGWHLHPDDPAAAAGLFLPSIAATFQPAKTTLSDGSSAGHARFPTVAVSYPLGGNVYFLQLSSLLDQRWEVRTESTVFLSGNPVLAREIYRSDGNVSRIQGGVARRIREDLAIGASFGSYIGSVERIYTRALDPETAGLGVEVYAAQGRWRASGINAVAGVAWDPSSLLRVSGSLSWSGKLELSPSEGLSPESGSYSIPIEFRAGATVSLVPGLSLATGVSYADWSKVGEELGEETTRSTVLSYGGGIEWTGPELFGRSLPLRIGARQRDLPFYFQGSSATERTFSGGVGFHLVDAQEHPLARVEVGVERGERKAGSLTESFLRTTLTLRLASG